jgi:putative sigma-54 modulation protein
MQSRVTARHFDLTDGLREYVDDRSRHLERFFSHIIDLNWVLDVDKHRYIVDLTAKVYGTTLSASGDTSDMRASVDEASDKMEKQLKKYKSRLKDRDQKAVAEGKGTQSFDTDDSDSDDQ